MSRIKLHCLIRQSDISTSYNRSAQQVYRLITVSQQLTQGAICRFVELTDGAICFSLDQLRLLLATLVSGYGYS